MLYIICQGGRNYVICHCYLIPAGLPLAQIARRGLVVIPLSYTISGKEHLCLAPRAMTAPPFFRR